MNTAKAINLAQLQDELTAAGFTHRGLGREGDHLYTYDDDGLPKELPDEWEHVIDVHVSDDAPKIKLMKADLAYARQNITQQIQRLGNLPNPTQDQTAILTALRGVRGLMIASLLDT